jgi:hypothetical protein
MSQSQAPNRWNTLVSKGMVIPFEDVQDMGSNEFRDKCVTVMYQLAKEVYELRKELEETKNTVQTLKKIKKPRKASNEELRPLDTCNTFSLLDEEE